MAGFSPSILFPARCNYLKMQRLITLCTIIAYTEDCLDVKTTLQQNRRNRETTIHTELRHFYQKLVPTTDVNQRKHNKYYSVKPGWGGSETVKTASSCQIDTKDEEGRFHWKESFWLPVAQVKNVDRGFKHYL